MQTLNQRLANHYNDLWSDFDDEEIEQVLDILETCNDDLSDMTKIDKQLLLRMINNDKELYNEVDEAVPDDDDLDDKDPFADF
ncbi:hypothetical protein [Flavobacterium sp.]|uniref:hypothetical protein n=1 Tax=Flavobacterium sp. TaxID=239 RepID=UPI0026391F24|nr:hypothetical protein [Flavobacterium sp.]